MEDALFESSFPLLFFNFIEKWWFHKFHLDYVALVHIKAWQKKKTNDNLGDAENSKIK